MAMSRAWDWLSRAHNEPNADFKGVIGMSRAWDW